MATQPLINIDPTSAPSQQAAFINQNFQTMQNSLNPLIVSDGTNNRIILGKLPDGTYGFKVSQSGVDVTTATNSQLIFNSSQDIFKIALTGTADLVIPASLADGATSTATVAHGLSSVPAVISYLKGDTTTAYLNNGQYYSMPYVGGFNGLVFQSRVDATNLYFEVRNVTGLTVSGLGTVHFKYYAMQETAL